MTDHLAGLADHLKPYVIAGASIQAPHVELADWHGEAARLGVEPARLANLIDAKERAFARLAWVMRDHEDYVKRHTFNFAFGALIEVLARCGALPADADAKLSDGVGLAVRVAWINEGMEKDREAWRWVLRILRQNEQDMMNDADREALAELPDRLRLYRGFAAPAYAPAAMLDTMARGPSWSIREDVAALYSKRSAAMLPELNAVRFIASADIEKSAADAYLTGPFDEIVVSRPDRFADLTIRPAPSCPEFDLAAAA